jgi:hypothetical protein
MCASTRLRRYVTRFRALAVALEPGLEIIGVTGTSAGVRNAAFWPMAADMELIINKR